MPALRPTLDFKYEVNFTFMTKLLAYTQRINPYTRYTYTYTYKRAQNLHTGANLKSWYEKCGMKVYEWHGCLTMSTILHQTCSTTLNTSEMGSNLASLVSRFAD